MASKDARDKDKGNVEFSFSLVLGESGPPKRFSIKEGERIVIGRRLDCQVPIAVSSVSGQHCEIFLKRKNREPILCCQDFSKNFTGVRHLKAIAQDKDFKELGHQEVDQLQHRTELLVPARQRGKSQNGDLRTKITVLFSLPDAFCPWTQTGRWQYEDKLGEGGLAVVYRARDVTQDNRVVAVKVSKFANMPSASQQNRHIYALHREARWSIERLHNVQDPNYDRGGAQHFAKYLEDHTGFAVHAPDGDFDKLRRRFEDPTFSWGKHRFDPPLAERPYVVVELIDGKLLQNVLESPQPLDSQERRIVVRQCTKALVYMERFGVIHRDFRGCNIFLEGRGPSCIVKTIDLGFMMSADESHARNPNPAIRCAWQGDPVRKLKFDWAPPEVRTRGAPNFGSPPFSFDVYSFGVLILKLLNGRTWAQDVLQHRTVAPQLQPWRETVASLGLSVEMLIHMLDQESPARRPLASDILQLLNLTRSATASHWSSQDRRSIDRLHGQQEPKNLRPQDRTVACAG